MFSCYYFGIDIFNFVDAKKVRKKGIADLRFFILFGKTGIYDVLWGYIWI